MVTRILFLLTILLLNQTLRLPEWRKCDSVVLRRTVVASGDWCRDNLCRSHHQSQVNGCGHLNVLSLVCVTLLVSFAIMLLAGRLKWHRSIVIGLFWSMTNRDWLNHLTGLLIICMFIRYLFFCFCISWAWTCFSNLHWHSCSSLSFVTLSSSEFVFCNW